VCNASGQCVCVPDCTGRQCGPDPACGQSCGTCPTGATCDANGQCRAPTGQHGDLCIDASDCSSGLVCVVLITGEMGYCASNCSCTDLTGCPANLTPPTDCMWNLGSSCACGYECNSGSASECPDNGEGWLCYAITGGYACAVDSCQANCTGRQCGPDPTCGASCGLCQAGQMCTAAGQCVTGGQQLGQPCAFTGGVNEAAGPCTTGLECLGIPADPAYPCSTDQSCIDLGFYANWNPDCVTGTGCGVSFCSSICGPDNSCPAGYEAYNLSGTCYCIPANACTPNCAGRQCGDDGCGGSCGTCPTGQSCNASGQCVAGTAGAQGDLCTSDPEICQSGLDCVGFGAEYGAYCTSQCSCSAGTGCPTGSPQSECMWQDQAGTTCWCGYECPSQSASACPGGGVGWTCLNVGQAEPFYACIPTAGACVPNCTGRVCGDDGCGGSCGTCQTGQSCNNSTGQCVAGSCSEVLLDPSFESGSSSAPWVMTSSAYGSPLCDPQCGGDYARTGTWFLWIGGGAADDADARQTVTIPTGTATLSAYVLFSGTVAADYFRFTVDGNEVARIQGTNAAYQGAYALLEANISTYANGGSHVIRVHGVTTNTAGSILVDDVSLLRCGN
jgi:hypothetical protein